MYCPEINEARFKQTLEVLNKYNPDDHIIETLEEINNDCPISGGKKMKGGINATTTKRIIKIIIYLIISALIALAGSSPNANLLTEGIHMMINGQCTHISNRLWGVFQNPVCIFYNNLTNAVLGAIRGDPTSITMIVGAATITIGTPASIVRMVDEIADRITSGVNIMGINNSNTNRSRSRSNIPTVISGGKSKSKKSKKSKTKKTSKKRK